MTQIIVALDVSSLEDADRIVAQVGPAAGFYKVGFQLFMAHGRAAVERLKKQGVRVFLDLKLHDIPQTVQNAVKEAAAMGVDAMSLHLAGGRAMLEAAAAVPNRPLLWGITVLTSLTDGDLKVLGGRTTAELVPDLAALGMASGVDGVVCSGQELPQLQTLTPRPQCVVPGVRMPEDPAGDQRRVITPAEAARAGADFIVVGRPITRAADPSAAARRIAAQLVG